MFVLFFYRPTYETQSIVPGNHRFCSKCHHVSRVYKALGALVIIIYRRCCSCHQVFVLFQKYYDVVRVVNVLDDAFVRFWRISGWRAPTYYVYCSFSVYVCCTYDPGVAWTAVDIARHAPNTFTYCYSCYCCRDNCDWIIFGGLGLVWICFEKNTC